MMFSGALACLAAALVGCGGNGGSDASVVRPPRPAPQSAEVRRQLGDPASPAGVVNRFWTYVQQGAVPAVLDVYDPRSVAGAGLDNFAGALAGQQQVTAGLKLNVVEVQSVDRNRIVVTEALPRLGAKSKYTFFLRRSKGKWQIAYDTFVAVALPASVTARVPAGAKRGTGEKVANAVLTGYRVAGLTASKQKAKKKRKKKSAPAPATPGG